MTYEDDIALLAEDIKRWAGADARIQEATEQLLKLFQAEVDALAFEVRELTIELGKLDWANRLADRDRNDRRPA